MTPLAILILRTFAFICSNCICIVIRVFRTVIRNYSACLNKFRDELSRHRAKSVYESWYIYYIYIYRRRIQNFLSAIPVVNKYIPRSIHGNKNIIKIEIIFVISISMCRYNWFSIYSFKVSFYFILFICFIFRECSFQWNFDYFWKKNNKKNIKNFVKW